MRDNQYQQATYVTCQLDGKHCIFISCQLCYKTDQERKEEEKKEAEVNKMAKRRKFWPF